MRHAGRLVVLLAALVWCAPAQAIYFEDHAPRLALSPDGRHVYAAALNQTTTYRRSQDGQLEQIGDTEPGGAAVAISPDGRFGYIAAAAQGDPARSLRILVRDRNTGLMTHVASTSVGAQLVTDMAISADGRSLYLAEAGQDAVIIAARDVTSGALRRVGAVWGGPAADDAAWLDGPMQLALPRDGRSLYVATTQGGLGALHRDPTTGSLTPESNPIAGTVATSVSLTAAGDWLYSGTLIWARNPTTGALSDPGGINPCGTATPCGPGPTAAVPDGSGVVIGNFYSGTLHLAGRSGSGLVPLGSWNASPNKPRYGGPAILAWAPDSQTLYAGLGYGEIAIWQRLAGPPWLRYAGVLESSHHRRQTSGVTINDGAAFTNSRKVTVRIGRPPGASSLRISNSTDFDQAPFRRFSPDGTYDWKLATTGLTRDVRRVHASYLDLGLAGHPPLPAELTDDIILDERAPRLLSATIASPRKGRARASRVRKLRLRASDNRSGVKQVQATRRRSRPGRKQRYTRTIRAPKGHGKIWVRVFDGAGNPSRWRAARQR